LVFKKDVAGVRGDRILSLLHDLERDEGVADGPAERAADQEHKQSGPS